MRFLRNILMASALAVVVTAGAEVVVFGTDTVVISPPPIGSLDLESIISSMGSFEEDGDDDDDVGSTLDYMASFFDAGFAAPPARNSRLFKAGRVPEGDIPVDVARFRMPAVGRVTSRYGWRRRYGRMHRGIDIGIARGDTIRAAFPGTVTLTGYDRRGYGYYLIMTHPNGLQTLYGHLEGFLTVPTETVDAGDPIALGGSTGNSTGPHLHFETRFSAVPIDPASIVDFRRRRVHRHTYIFNKERVEAANAAHSPSGNKFSQKVY